MTTDVANLDVATYICLPGVPAIDNFQIRCKGPMPFNITHFSVTYFYRKSNDLNFRVTNWKKCSYPGLRHTSCLEIIPSERREVTYFLVGNIRPDIEISLWYEKLSWHRASKLCSKLGGKLPYFMSRKALDEFLNMLQTVRKIPLIEAIFISLQYNTSQVSIKSFL